MICSYFQRNKIQLEDRQFSSTDTIPPSFNIHMFFNGHIFMWQHQAPKAA